MATGHRNCVGNKRNALKTAGNAFERQYHCLAIALWAQYTPYRYERNAADYCKALEFKARASKSSVFILAIACINICYHFALRSMASVCIG